jgi:hypothetical protein
MDAVARISELARVALPSRSWRMRLGMLTRMMNFAELF